MKSLVVFYSLDGHTRRAAEIIARTAGADLHELRPLKTNAKTGFLKFFLGGMHASFGHKAVLRDPLPDLTAYDRVLYRHAGLGRKAESGCQTLSWPAATWGADRSCCLPAAAARKTPSASKR